MMEPVMFERGKRWNEARQAALRKLWPEPISLDEIADRLGTDRCMVRRWGNLLSLPGRVKQPRERPWSDEEVATLRRMWADGASATMIRRVLGIRSRNAVLGKVHRMGLAERATVARKSALSGSQWKRAHQGKARRQLAPTLPKPKPVRLPPPLPPECLMLPLMELTHLTCRFPVGEATGAKQLFCAAPKSVEGSLCRYHHTVCYYPYEARRARDLQRVGRLAA